MKNHCVADVQGSNRETRSAALALWIERAEFIVGLAVTVVALFLFTVRLTHAGPLWRDEAESIQSSQMSLPQMLQTVQFSSFPILFPVVLRAYSLLFGTGDLSLRCFGASVGVLFLVAAWLPIRKLTGKVPLFLLAIVGLNANFLISGMALRGYGAGALLMLLAVACTCRFILNSNTWTLLALLVANLACSQILFLNLPIVMAFAVAAGCVLLIQRQARWLGRLAVVTLTIALSYVFYVLQFYRSGSVWGEILHVPMSFALIWQAFLAAWGNISALVSNSWLTLIGGAMLGALWTLTPWNKRLDAQRDFLVFAILAITLAAIASYWFVRMLPRQPESRYFLVLTVVMAAFADLVWAHFPFWMRAARIGMVLIGAIALPQWLWSSIVEAESNSETVARAVEQNSAASDLIVVSPWSYGVSFNWYYRGAIRWISVPEIEDHRVHRYDLLGKKMQSTSPVADVESEIENALKSDKRVWFVGQIELPPPGEAPFQIGPAPDPNFGWQAAPFRKAWSQRIGLFLVQHVVHATTVDLGSAQTMVSPRENMMLFRLEGWKE